MRRTQSRARFLSLVAALVLAGGCTKQGSFSVTFSWEGQPPDFAGTLYMSAEVSEQGGSHALASTPQKQYAANSSLPFDDVPNGTNLVVTAELRDAPGSYGQVLAYGISQPFSLEPGKTTAVSIDVPMHVVLPLPAVPAIQLVTAYAQDEASSRMVMLRLIAPKGTAKITLSNAPDLAAGAATDQFGALMLDSTATAPSGFLAFRQSWDIDRGITACTAGNVCERTVYAQFVDANGFHSATAQVTIQENLLTPQLVAPNVVPADPAAAGPGTTVVVVATPSEPLWQPSMMSPMIIPHVFNQASPANEIAGYFTLLPGSDYTFVHKVAPNEPNGHYFVVFDLTDQAGNTGTYPMAAGQESIAWTVITTEPSDYINPETISLNGTVFSGQDGSNQVSLSFDLDAWDHLPASNISAAIGSLALDCVTSTDSSSPTVPAYSCTGTITSAADDGQGSVFAVINAYDPAGIGVTIDAPITLQFNPPVVTFATVGYEPGPDNPLFMPTGATVGTTIKVTVKPDEEVDVLQPLSMSAKLPDGTMLHFPKVSWTIDSQTPAACYDADAGYHCATEVTLESDPVPPLDLDGGVIATLSPQITWTDSVRNATSTATWTTPPILLKTTKPPMPATATPGVIVYARTPWGSESVGSLPTYTVEGADGGAPGASTVIIYDSNDAGPSELGRATVNRSGAFDVTLSRADHPLVYASSVDSVGNLSDPAQVHDVVWTGSFGRKTRSNVIGNPHIMFTTQDYDVSQPAVDGGSPDAGTLYLGPLVQPSDFTKEPSTYAGLAPDAADGGLTVSAATLWKQRSPSDGLDPSGREYVSLAYDLARGVAVLFGGYDSSNNALNDTWEWDGQRWSNPKPTSGSPPTRSGHALAYDIARGVTVLFGGYGSNGPMQDTWEWDGQSWTQMNFIPATKNAPAQIITPVPDARTEHAMSYDAERGVTVLFGGSTSDSILQDTWEWNGSAWQEASTGSGPSSPPARESMAMAYDTTRRTTLMFGGCGAEDRTSGACTQILGDLWEWNGSSWMAIAPSTPTPPARYGHTLTFDSQRSVLVLFGGCAGGDPEGLCTSPLNDTWEWNGVAWTEVSDGTGNAPSARSTAAMTYDVVHETAVLFGGCAVPNPVAGMPECYPSDSDTWTWDGHSWVNRTAVISDPPSRWGPAMAYDSARQQTVLYGGFSNSYTNLSDTRLWNGASWSQVVGTGPPARDLGRMAFDSTSEVAVLFGGCPTVFDELTSGYFCAAFQGDTWLWNGTSWAQVTPVGTSPSARSSHGLVYDSSRQVTLLFGGCETETEATPGDDTTYTCTHADQSSAVLGDTWQWTWNAAAGQGMWTNVTPSDPTQSPTARFAHAMAYDSGRDVTVLFGGCPSGTPELSCDTGQYLNDTWEWNGSAWKNVTPADSANSPPGFMHAAMAYDVTRGVTVLTGGENDTGYSDQTYEWNGQAWVNASASGTRPAPRAFHAMVYDSARQTNVLYGGANAGATQGDTWEARSRPTIRPAEIAEFSLLALGSTNPQITSMTISGQAGATGNTLVVPGIGAPVAGATMAAWNVLAGGWVALDSNSGTLGAPSPLFYSATSPADAASYVFGAGQTINVALFPTAGRGNGATPAEIDVDYLQVVVQYTQ